MPPQVTPPRESYIILVTGAMNPQVHTPQFYRTIGAMDENELQASLKMPQNTTAAAMSQFEYGTLPITVSCQPTQWWIQSANDSLWDRMTSIASTVFTKLGGTPVSAYLLASQRHIETTVDVKPVLERKIAELSLGFPSGTSQGSSIELAVNEADYVVAAIMQPSVLSEHGVYLQYQHNYQVPVPDAGTLIPMGNLIQSRIEGFLSASKQFAKVAVAAISGS
jgi:hypothetical protein